MTFLMIGLAVMKLTDLLKQAIPWSMMAWSRSVLSILLAIALSVWFRNGFHQMVLLALASAGTAAFLHELTGVLSMLSDSLKQAVIQRAASMNQRYRG